MIKNRIFFIPQHPKQKMKNCDKLSKSSIFDNYFILLLPLICLISIVIFSDIIRPVNSITTVKLIDKEYAVVYYYDKNNIRDESRFIYKRFKTYSEAEDCRFKLNSEYHSINKIQGAKIGVEEVQYLETKNPNKL